jgi:hypothetical protein
VRVLDQFSPRQKIGEMNDRGVADQDERHAAGDLKDAVRSLQPEADLKQAMQILLDRLHPRPRAASPSSASLRTTGTFTFQPAGGTKSRPSRWYGRLRARS